MKIGGIGFVICDEIVSQDGGDYQECKYTQFISIIYLQRKGFK